MRGNVRDGSGRFRAILASLRRPDLPLILIVLAVGAALAIFASDEEPPTPRAAGDLAQADLAGDPGAEFLADPSPALTRCLLGDEVPGGGGGGLPTDPAELVGKASAQVERLRELRFSRPVDARFLSPAELRDHIAKLLEDELPPKAVAREQAILEELGAIPPGTDLMALEEDALGSQVIGLYDPDTKELLVQRSGDAGPDEAITLAHELEHALADQALDLNEPKGLGTADGALARIAVIEGDATLTMTRYAIAELDLDELGSLGSESVPSAEREFDQLPDYLQRELLFPYFEGLRLNCYEWLTGGGWKAIDRLYDHPPRSTYEVMFPAAYGERPPAKPPPPGRPGAGWKPVEKRDLGAAELSWLFAAPGGEAEAALPDPRRLVAGWRGGEVELWERGDRRALGIALVADPGSGLCGALSAWYGAAFPSEQQSAGPRGDVVEFSNSERAAILACRGRDVRLGIAPDRTTAARIASPRAGTRGLQVERVSTGG